MAAFYQTFTTARTTPPDPAALATAVRTAAGDATAVLRDTLGGTWRGKKATAWTAPQITATQNALDTTAADTPQKAAQRYIDAMPIELKAILLTLLDEINRLRTQPTTTFATIAPATAIQAVRDKAGTL